MNNETKPILRVLNGEAVSPVPIWLMRQAGRYLPEYRELRSKAGGFLDMVYNPDFACEVTMQPIRRYRMDGAILFSDILVIPDALGQEVRFEEGRGPILDPIRSTEELDGLSVEKAKSKFETVAETVSKVTDALKAEGFDHTTLLGFSGSPWTVACYMVEGQSSKTYFDIRSWAIKDPNGFQKLIDILVEATVQYLDLQIRAGAEAVKLFDSWAGILDETSFRRWIINPTAAIVKQLRSIHPDTPIIGFPRQAGVFLSEYVETTGVTAVAIDQHISPVWVNENLPKDFPVQGNIDPFYLFAEDQELKSEAQNICDAFQGRPHIFNLGHGVNKETDPDKVKTLVDCVRQYTSENMKDKKYG